MSEQIKKTEQEFKEILNECQSLFSKKLHDYGASWRILRPSSLTDQLFIKAKRIRSIEITGENRDITPDEAMALYEKHAKATYELMLKKNHDYGEAWRDMRVSSYTDFILTKIERVKEMEDLNGQTLVSEGIDSNYMDIIIYAVFGAIKLHNE